MRTISKLSRIFNRPLSPHLSIYSNQFTSMFSIWHRISGVILIIFLVVILFFLKIISYKTIYLLNKYSLNLNFWIQNTLFLNLTLFLYYHVINGIRHIIWDLGYILFIDRIQVSAKIIIISILIISIILFYKIIN